MLILNAYCQFYKLQIINSDVFVPKTHNFLMGDEPFELYSVD